MLRKNPLSQVWPHYSGAFHLPLNSYDELHLCDVEGLEDAMAVVICAMVMISCKLKYFWAIDKKDKKEETERIHAQSL